MKFLVFGSVNIDHVYRLNHIVRGGETVSARQHEAIAGGKGLNQAIALARSGCPTWFAGAMGEDGRFLKELMGEAGIHTSLLRELPGPSGHAIIQVDDNGQNAIIVYGGANHQITPAMIDETLERFEAGDWLLMQNEISCGEYLLRRAAQRGLHTALNPSPEPGQLKKWPLEEAEWLLLNEIEGEELSGEKEPERMLNALLARCPNSHLVLTLGENGAHYADGAQHVCQSAFPVKAVDTTAAGDTFTGYFLSAIAEGKSAVGALKLAAAAAAIAVTRPGAAPSIPRLSEVTSFIENLA